MYRLTSSNLVRKRVMIVEPEQDVVEIMESAVAVASGVVVFRAGTVAQAMEMLKRLPHVDCLLVDVETVEASGTTSSDPVRSVGWTSSSWRETMLSSAERSGTGGHPGHE